MKKEIEYTKLMQFHIQTINDTRKAMIDIIRAAVEKHGCIGTFYRNLGLHHTKDHTEEEYDDSPVVVIRNETYNCYGGFEGNTVYDLFIHPEDGKLLATLNGECGEDFDEPVEHVQVEGLICIVAWLTENGFVEDIEEDPWRCEECGSTDVEYTDNGTLGDWNDFWCNYCEEHSRQIRESELMVTIQDWFHRGLQPDENEVILGLDPDDYGREEAYLDACTDHWNALQNEQKIAIWKQLTYDKR